MPLTRLYALTTRLAVTLLLCVTGAQAAAADWQKVLSDRNRTVEIDRASIFDSDSGTKVSWGRIVMSEAGAAAVGYRTIKALNRYDCLNRSFFTIKRVYLDASDRVIREETNADQAPVMVTRDTADERMWREVCRPVGGADLGKIAEAAGKAAASATTALTPAPSAVRPAPAPTKPTPAATTPAAVPMPSIRPNLAELAAKNEADSHAPLPTTQAPEPPSASPTLPTPPLTAPTPLPPASLPPALADKPVAAAAVAAIPQQLQPAPAPPAAATTAAPPPVRPAAIAAAPVAAAPALPRAVDTPSRPASPAPRAQAPAPVRQTGTGGWSYAGDTGPERWGRLHPEWTLCTEGERQSPIDLRDGMAVELDPVRFEYPATAFRITDTGNMLRVDVAEIMFMEVRRERYRLEYFTLHRPSQERVGGGASAMAVHLHHRASDGKAAILAVLMELGEEPNPLLQVLLNNLPLEKGSTYAPAAAIDLAAFLPASPGHFLYMGSMTTPPCTEGVLWVVMKEPVHLSEDQQALFSRLYPRNSRPIQAPKGRRVLESR